MRTRRPLAVVLLVAAALAAAPSSLSASSLSWRQVPFLGALDQAWHLVSRLLAGASVPAVRPKNGASPDPNGGASSNTDEGASPDPNGGAAASLSPVRGLEADSCVVARAV